MNWESSYIPIVRKRILWILCPRVTFQCMLSYFWCRWEINSLYTIFSYILTSLSNDMRCGKTLYHWFFKKSNYIYGGRPSNPWQKKQNLIWWIFLSIICLSTEHSSHTKQILSIFLLLLFWYFIINFLELLGMNRLVSTSIQPIIPSITKVFQFLQKQRFNWDI